MEPDDTESCDGQPYLATGSEPPNTPCEQECSQNNQDGGFDYHPQTNCPGVVV